MLSFFIIILLLSLVFPGSRFFSSLSRGVGCLVKVAVVFAALLVVSVIGAIVIGNIG